MLLGGGVSAVFLKCWQLSSYWMTQNRRNPFALKTFSGA